MNNLPTSCSAPLAFALVRMKIKAVSGNISRGSSHHPFEFHTISASLGTSGDGLGQTYRSPEMVLVRFFFFFVFPFLYISLYIYIYIYYMATNFLWWPLLRVSIAPFFLFLQESGCDVVIVGRGVCTASDPVSAAREYRTRAWNAYKQRTSKQQQQQ